MPELTDAQKVLRNDTGKRMADALEALAGTGGRGLPPGGADGDVLVKNGATDYSGKWTSTPPQMGSLAYINTGSTADKTYYEGEYLVCSGQLYKVITSTISQGQTLTPNGNIKAVTVGEKLAEISHLHWGGNCIGLARNDGRVNITLPYQGDYTRVAVNTTQITAAGTAIYGSIAPIACTFEIQNLGFSDAKAIYFNLQPNVTLSDYTDLAKQVLIYISEEIVFTLS